MSLLAPLIEIQEFDLAADAARERRANLPERKTLDALDAKRVACEAELSTTRAERAALEGREGELALAVAEVVKALEAADLERYSGKRMNRTDAAAHDESQQQLREKQAGLEEEEMALLESIEEIDLRLADQDARRAANDLESEQVREAIRKAESEVDSELGRLAESRERIVSGLPAAVLTAYERVRTRSELGGRAAAMLGEGDCGACRIKLPSLEYKKMRDAPDDAVIQCPQCRRVLIR